ncbi:MAG: glucose 1-dehydrogenase [Candidatus Aminicenantales bacterium]
MNIDISPIQADEVLVKTLETGICSTDRELWDNQRVIFPEGFDFLVIGHEAVGEVEQVGANISRLKKGDIVVPTVRRGCGECFLCNNGRSDMCQTSQYKERGIKGAHGFMSEYFIENEDHLIKVPDDLKEAAVLIEPLSVGVKAIEESWEIQKCRFYGVSDQQEKPIFKKCLVIGTGSIGLLSGLIIRNHGIELTCFDIDSEDGVKANIIRTIGGQYINLVPYSTENGIDINPLSKDYDIENIDLIIDASGNPLICLQLVKFLQYNGICVLLSLPLGEDAETFYFNRTLSNLVLKNQILLGSVNSNYSHFQKAVRNLEQSEKSHHSLLKKIITHRYPFLNYAEAFNVPFKDRIKVVLNWV